MVDDFQKIDGVGQAREESLISEGYEEFEDLAQADGTNTTRSKTRRTRQTGCSVAHR